MLEALRACGMCGSKTGCSVGAGRAQGDEAFQCAVCKDRTAATKRLRLHRLPPVLMLHIKRFKSHGTTREKLTTDVTFPLHVRTPLRLSSPSL